MKQLFFLILIATTNMSAQQLKLDQVHQQLDLFEKHVTIPSGYSFLQVTEQEVDKKAVYLFRYQKLENRQLKGEHFSFIVTKEKPYRILGFTNMDEKYTNSKQLTKEETAKIAKNFLDKIDPKLNQELSQMFIEQHDEEIVINGKDKIVTGMKYKCYNQTDDTYAWVIVGADGSIVTFEREILWSNGMQKRISEKWLHDGWLIENNKTL